MSNQDDKQIRIGGRSLAISGNVKQDWFIGWSPDYDSLAAEGPWEEWVRLAWAILSEDNKRRPSTHFHNQPQR